ncbi:protein DnaJ [Seminavis robusta]|uniref:Protein DnaJ n=1 Tax=Seminavis robusta TaxID=568900 RepID=A0A9N8DW69_9STRA|nr:protein DnaJ [Seminavis robusta]|eukprot:Sro341_g121340.1 protein DnaJ (770) ;mRNA; r:7214-9608
MQHLEGLEDSPDWYSLLNIANSASQDEIQKAYKTLSKTFHPDRLRAHNAAESEEAQETFVAVKTAYEILGDPVYRFAYDHYGHEGVRYLATCQQVKDGRQSTQQNTLALDLNLYSKLQGLLQKSSSDVQMQLAIQLMKQAMERYKQQLKVIKERLQDSIFSVETTLEFPCEYHSRAAVVAEGEGSLPYLEMEEARIEFSVKTTNQKPRQPNGAQPPQGRVYSTTLGAKTTWTASGKSRAEVSVEGNYKPMPSSKTSIDWEVSTPVTKVPNIHTRPVKLQLSSTHEFLGGTYANFGIRGSNVSRGAWEYFAVTHRRLIIGNNNNNNSNSSAATTPMSLPSISASCAGGMKAFSGQILYGFLTLTTVVPPQRQQQQTQEQHNSNETTTTSFWSPSTWTCSTPVLSVRAGYHPFPLFASLKCEEFGKPWASLNASWSWNFMEDFSKIKVLLSADLWGSFEDNDTTTIRTGIKHDLYSGWTWLWEWEEMDWTFKMPISLSLSKNASWMAVAMGLETTPSDAWHNALGTLLACCIVSKVAETIMDDWAPQQQRDKRKSFNAKSRDATFSEPNRKHVLDHSPSEEGFRLLMTRIAEKKRGSEGLVIQSAKLVTSAVTPSPVVDGMEAAQGKPTPSKDAKDLTQVLQFWVKDGKVSLPCLASQTSSTQNFYGVGGVDRTLGESGSDSTFYSLAVSLISHVSEVCFEQVATVVNTLDPAGRRRVSETSNTKGLDYPYDLLVRYQYRGNIYETCFEGHEEIELPNPQALLLGPASTVA